MKVFSKVFAVLYVELVEDQMNGLIAVELCWYLERRLKKINEQKIQLLRLQNYSKLGSWPF